MSSKPIPLESLFHTDGFSPNRQSDPRDALNKADVILGVDAMSQREFLVYGRRILKRIKRSGKPKSLAILRIEIDQETEDLEKLIALVRVLKGRDDYEA